MLYGSGAISVLGSLLRWQVSGRATWPAPVLHDGGETILPTKGDHEVTRKHSSALHRASSCRRCLRRRQTRTARATPQHLRLRALRVTQQLLVTQGRLLLVAP